MDMTCPKCHGQMRTYERSGLNVDQCTECRGVFLDRGELDLLIDAESQWQARTAAAPAAHAGTAATSGGLASVVAEAVSFAKAQKQHSSHGSTKKPKSFLGELLG